MRLRVLLSFLLFSFCWMTGKVQAQSFDRTAYYRALSSTDVSDVNDELEVVKGAKVSEKEAYEGTLLMKKAGLVSKPADKLSNFKSGKIKLETEISKDTSNAEYRFLRLIIQEHAPKIVKYSSDLDKDRKFIRSAFAGLPAALQQAIIDYSKNSRILHPDDFN